MYTNSMGVYTNGMTDTNPSLAKMQRYSSVVQVFTPGSPINHRALFAGRIEQVMQVLNAIREPGRHVVLYGERGVGKTSLANVLGEFLEAIDPNSRQPARVNCNTKDDFKSIWVKILREIGSPYDTDGDWSSRHPDPEYIRFELQRAEAAPSVIIIDELDRVEDEDAISLLADTVKTLSDHTVGVTLLFVGVADSIDDLIYDHRSVERALAQVRMQRMSMDELVQIVDNGLDKLGMTIDPKAKRKIARLSEGLPHYTHLLAQHAAQSVVADDRDQIEINDVNEAIEKTVESHFLLSEHQNAIRSPHLDNLYEQVLIACALASKDELGYFRASAVRDSLTRVMGKRYEIPAFARHLKRFSDPLHGVLVKTGEPQRHIYRFINPLMQPYAILSGLSKGLIAEGAVEEAEDQPISPSTEQQPLF
jgi:Cdc6-like AAA superfamily ATPase